MTKFEKLKAALDAVYATYDAAYADAAHAAYATRDAYDARDAYKKELDKQNG